MFCVCGEGNLRFVWWVRVSRECRGLQRYPDGRAVDAESTGPRGRAASYVMVVEGWTGREEVNSNALDDTVSSHAKNNKRLLRVSPIGPTSLITGAGGGFSVDAAWYRLRYWGPCVYPVVPTARARG